MIKDEILKITNEELDAIDLSAFKPFVSDYYQKYFFLNSGEEHYRLLVKLSTLINNSFLLDIGTAHGMSALSLSFNETNEVRSWDIEDKKPNLINRKNIIFEISDKFGKVGNEYKKDEFHQPRFVYVDVKHNLETYTKEHELIFVDTTHDGKFEIDLVEFLKEIKYKGVVLLDDIYLPSMQHFWNVDCKDFDKIDISHIGHWSGSGIIFFE